MVRFLSALKVTGILLAMLVGVVYLGNASWARGRPGEAILLAHRGVAQQFSREGLDRTTCTAAQMLPPTHDLLENTIPSIAAAFEYGADVVEIDVHPTTDGEFAVFHDWTLDCRTNGQGVTREQTMEYLRTLDVGHGYTADGGQTFPFRGRFVGAMPTLGEVLSAFPNERFLINVKSNEPDEADLLASYLIAYPDASSRLMFYGGEAPMAQLRTHLADARIVSRATLKRCMVNYLATGWFGRIHDACRNTVVFLPINYRVIPWGWPNLFVERMARVNTEVFVVGPLTRDAGTSGATAVDAPEDVDAFIRGYAGGVATDRIDIMGPAVRRRQESQ